ncbi:hypothetical protein J6590_089625 [Homalodisca vitripennis]|nr:hypothetical protein J6590_100012 [Homalodisca vitripennis]KAG8285211.1 hypothetical protein J6590_085765 [Homalodisca vitripennis]KAG8290126.1 hypothetical protein J6590_089625 [Homalodisca vitripennis]
MDHVLLATKAGKAIPRTLMTTVVPQKNEKNGCKCDSAISTCCADCCVYATATTASASGVTAALAVSEHRHRGAAVSAEAVTAIPCVTQFSDYTLDTIRQLRGGSEIFTSNFKRRTSDERIKSKAVF